MTTGTEARPGVFVAVVDDDRPILEAMTLLLELAGHSVVAFDSALAFLESRPASLACLILDHHMPRMTGLDLAARLRTSGETIRILLVTGSPSAAIALRAAELGIEKVLEKPPSEDDLLNFINGH